MCFFLCLSVIIVNRLFRLNVILKTLYTMFSKEAQHGKHGKAPEYYLVHTTTKVLQTVVILDNVQSLVKLTPWTAECTDHFQTNTSWLRLAAVWQRPRDGRHKGGKTKRNIWDFMKTAEVLHWSWGSLWKGQFMVQQKWLSPACW